MIKQADIGDVPRRFLRAMLLMLFGVLSARTQDAAGRWYEAVRGGNFNEIRTMIQREGVSVRDQRGTTPLPYAAAIGNAETVKLLLEAGADVNARDASGSNALIWASGDLRKIRLLLAHGADAKVQSNIGRTPLMTAACSGGSLDAVKLLVAKGADVSAKDKNGTPLTNIAAQSDHAAVVRYLVEHGAAADTKDAVGLTPLFWAAMNGNSGLTRRLLERGADARSLTVEVMDRVKNGPIETGRLGILNLAAAYGGSRTIRILIQAGADVNAVETGHGYTPLTRAITTYSPDVKTVHLLMAHGADPGQKLPNGRSPAEWAAMFRHPGVLAALRVSSPPIDTNDSGFSWGAQALDIRARTERGLELLQRTSALFLERGGCVSCHAQNLTGMAVGVAREQHLHIDETLAAASAKENSVLSGSMEQLYLQLVDPPTGQGQDGTMAAVLQMNAEGVPPSRVTDAMLHYLAAAQHPDGSWRSLGLTRPPIEDTSVLNTAMGLRCLQLYLWPARQVEFERRVARAARWLERVDARSTPDRAMQLLGLQWAHGSAPAMRIRDLLAIQRQDGGWPQTPYLASDAYGTGIALYALHHSGIPPSHPAYRRGVSYLLNTQESDGSWHVSSRSPKFQPYFESGFPHGPDQWISQAATAWAVMALAYAVNDVLPASLASGSR